jgi:hypothetical protein
LPLAYHESEIDEHLYICKTGVSFFVNCRPPTHFIIVAWLDLQKKWRQSYWHWREMEMVVWFSFYFTWYDTGHDDGIELVMCQTNERPEKHAEEMMPKKKKRRRICHLPSNGGHFISYRHNLLINASSSSRHCIRLKIKFIKRIWLKLVHKCIFFCVFERCWQKKRKIDNFVMHLLIL